MAASSGETEDCEIKADDCEPLMVREPILSPVGECPSDDTKPMQSYLPNVAKFYHSSPYYNNARRGIYRRFSKCDWDASYAANKAHADTQRRLAELKRADVWGAIRVADRAKNRQCANTKKLGDRAFDLNYWKNELVQECQIIENELKAMLDQKRLLEKMMEDARTCLQASEECLLQRERRNGIEMVRDSVERNLSKEILRLRTSLDTLKRMWDKVNVQIKLDRAAQHSLDVDLRNKQHAQHIDERMHRLANDSIELAYHDGIEYHDDTVTTMKTWLRFTRENLCRAQSERHRSAVVRAECEQLIRREAMDIWRQVQLVSRMIAIRVANTNDAVQKLKQHVERVTREKKDVQQTIDDLLKAIEDKDIFIKVAETRLQERSQRLGCENSHDKPMIGLQTEVVELKKIRDELKSHLLSSQLTLSRLDKTLAILHTDIDVKENTLLVDSNGLTTLRVYIHIEPCIGVAFAMPRCQYDCLQQHKCIPAEMDKRVN